MKVIKIVTPLACSFFIVLCFLITTVENPEIALYEKTVESLMVHEGLSSLHEVLKSFPELKEIKLKMNRITYLNNRIHNITGGPAPDISKQESLQIKNYAHEIRQLRKVVKKELSQLVVNYAQGQP